MAMPSKIPFPALTSLYQTSPSCLLDILTASCASQTQRAPSQAPAPPLKQLPSQPGAAPHFRVLRPKHPAWSFTLPFSCTPSPTRPTFKRWPRSDILHLCAMDGGVKHKPAWPLPRMTTATPSLVPPSAPNGPTAHSPACSQLHLRSPKSDRAGGSSAQNPLWLPPHSGGKPSEWPPGPGHSPTGSSPTRLQPRRPPPVPRTSQTCSCLSRSSCLRAFAYALPYVGACSFPQIVTLHLLRGFAQLSASQRGRRRLCYVKRQYPVPTPPRPRLPCFSPQHFSPPDTPCVDLPDGHPTPF